MTTQAPSNECFVCADCRNVFLQPPRCTTCGAEKLYDTTVRNQVTTIERLRWNLAEVRKEVCAVNPDWNRALRLIDQTGTAPEPEADLRAGLQMLIRAFERRGVGTFANEVAAAKALLGSDTEPPYWTRSFWSPCRKYIVTAHSYGAGEIAVQDDDGREWEPTGRAENVAGPSPTKSGDAP